MKQILIMSAILFISIGVNQNILLEHELEGRKNVHPIDDIDSDGIPELLVEIE